MSNMQSMLKKRTAPNYKPPFGYDVTEEGNLIPLEDDLELLEEIAELVEQRALSFRDGALWLSAKSSRTISHEGLRKRLMQSVRLDAA
jgi:hypothetical protein